MRSVTCTLRGRLGFVVDPAPARRAALAQPVLPLEAPDLHVDPVKPELELDLGVHAILC
jgi:hypothetical protein